MEFSKDDVETIFWLLMRSGRFENENIILDKIFEFYRPCPICAGFFEKSENHRHDNID